MKNMTLKSMLPPQAVSLNASQNIVKALDMMAERSISSVVIVDEHNVPVGIFTEHDALRIVAEGIDTALPIAEVMSPSPFCVDEALHLHDAYALMEEKGYRHLVVTDDAGRFGGVVSEGDFLRHIGFEYLTRHKKVSEAMSNSPLIIEPAMSLNEVAALMNERRCDYAVALEGSHPSGLITERDIARWCAHSDEKGEIEAKELLHANFRIIRQSIPLQEAATMMEEHGVHQLIVVDEKENLMGLLSRHDVLHAVHGAYFEYLLRIIEQKNETISRMGRRKKELSTQKETIEKNALKLQTLFEVLPEGVVLIDGETLRMVEFNRAAHEQLGYSAEEFAVLSVHDYEESESVDETQRRAEEIRRTGQATFETTHRTKNGDLVDVWVNTIAITLEEKLYFIAVFRDITPLKRSQEELERSKNEFARQSMFMHTLIDTIPDMIWLKDTDGIYMTCNPMFERFFGAKEADIVGKGDADFVGPELARFFRANDQAAIDAGTLRKNEEYLKFADGSREGYFETIKMPMRDAEGNIIGVLGIARDITERKLYEEQLEQLANYDPLTGLANRSLLLSHLQNTITQAKRNKTKVALLMFDLDRFKDINDSYGHGAGDELLRQVAERFVSRLRQGDLISRLGGDEFAVVMENIPRFEDAGRLAEEMIATVGAEYKLSGGEVIHIGASAGIVLFPDHADEASILLQYADAALYKSKSEGRGVYHYYTDELTELARKRINCETRLRKALLQNELEVYYQPQVHLQTGRIVGAEALVRWNDPERGVVSPGLFIPLAEETGLIGAIGEWVLNRVCEQGRIWLDAGHRLTLAVNVSAHQVRHQNVPLMVEKALKQSGFEPSRLEIELTESALMQREEEAVGMLHTLRAQGIRLAIDDFGTGYSSLSYLKRFPIDVLKIDKSFVDDIPYDQDDMAIVTAIIAMGHALGFQILAEGCEQEEQVAFLKEKGCTLYQGYYKSPPLPADAFEKLLKG